MKYGNGARNARVASKTKTTLFSVHGAAQKVVAGRGLDGDYGRTSARACVSRTAKYLICCIALQIALRITGPVWCYTSVHAMPTSC